MKISIITLFPEMFDGPFKYSIVQRAIEKKLVQISFINLRDFGLGKHKLVDDTPYGGGYGMILRADVLLKAVQSAKIRDTKTKQKVVLLSPHGKSFKQKIAKRFSKLDNLILICGHYEGFDERIKNYIDEEISVGDFILTGGELPAMLVTDSVVRLIKGAIAKGSPEEESFSPLLEYPQYTKPAVFKGLHVPDILLSGNHKEIAKWRMEKSLQITRKLRPDLIKTASNSSEKKNWPLN